MTQNTNPYTLSVDYDALFERINKGEIVAAFVDMKYAGCSAVFRDICQVKMSCGQILATVRGTGYFDISELDVRICQAKDIKELFISQCSDLNLGWIHP